VPADGCKIYYERVDRVLSKERHRLRIVFEACDAYKADKEGIIPEEAIPIKTIRRLYDIDLGLFRGLKGTQ